MANYYRALESIGDAAFDQRLYTIAAKKFTEANSRIKVRDYFTAFCDLINSYPTENLKVKLKKNSLGQKIPIFDWIRVK